MVPLKSSKNLIAVENELKNGELTEDLYVRAKNKGFLDRTIEKITGRKVENPLVPVYKMVDTCAAEFEAETPYFYSTFDKEMKLRNSSERRRAIRKQLFVFGSGPIRIGQGIEFDYASVHCVWALKKSRLRCCYRKQQP